MSFWQKITMGTKFLFGGWESALDYLLKILNEFLSKPSIAGNIKKVYDTCTWALNWLLKIKPYIPEKWLNEYNAITDVVADVLSIAADGQLTTEEVIALGDSFKEAKAKWDED